MPKDEKKRITGEIPMSEHRKLKKFAASKGMSMIDIIRIGFTCVMNGSAIITTKEVCKLLGKEY